MKVLWINRSFLDYRVPVYTEFDRQIGGGLFVFFSDKHTSERVRSKITSALGHRAVALTGERVIFRKGDNKGDFANSCIEVVYQPGLFKGIRECKPDVVIAEGFFRWTPIAVFYCLIHRVPLVISYERTHHTERNSQWFRTTYRKAVTRAADAICCNGSLSADYSNWLGMPMAKIVTGAMAADSEKLQQACELISTQERDTLRKELRLMTPVFLYVGQLVKRKGIEELLTGWKLMQSQRDSNVATLLIVGDGPERTNLIEFVRHNELLNVRFAEAVDYDTISRYYAIADVFVAPTLEDNWSLVVPEAMACGLPILCSIYNGCWPELVVENVNGFIFNPLDAEDIVAKLNNCLNNIEELRAMGEESRKIQEAFSPARAARAYHSACSIAMGKEQNI